MLPKHILPAIPPAIGAVISPELQHPDILKGAVVSLYPKIPPADFKDVTEVVL